uniref:Uncharacterized protein n=1 Tax=Sinorhizobium meliloti (strain SM11) TaxID=707241 RepID=Q1WLC6_SINMM|nr:hypothetical protein [Sinorhizobium meliloti]
MATMTSSAKIAGMMQGREESPTVDLSKSADSQH